MPQTEDTTNIDHSDNDDDRTRILDGRQRREFFADEGVSLLSSERRISVIQRLISLFK